jgi:hypothetical protein
MDSLAGRFRDRGIRQPEQIQPAFAAQSPLQSIMQQAPVSKGMVPAPVTKDVAQAGWGGVKEMTPAAPAGGFSALAPALSNSLSTAIKPRPAMKAPAAPGFAPAAQQAIAGPGALGALGSLGAPTMKAQAPLASPMQQYTATAGQKAAGQRLGQRRARSAAPRRGAGWGY